VVIGGQRAIPRRLEEWGYPFAFPELEPALGDLLSKS
jgi:NAD dependent epimerase/dehydratase family enzyme